MLDYMSESFKSLPFFFLGLAFFLVGWWLFPEVPLVITLGIAGVLALVVAIRAGQD